MKQLPLFNVDQKIAMREKELQLLKLELEIMRLENEFAKNFPTVWAKRIGIEDNSNNDLRSIQSTD